jgi:hypothetical protein
MNISSIRGPQRICLNNSIGQFTIPAVQNASSYTWTVGGGATLVSNSNNATINFANVITSMVQVKVHVVNSCGQFADQTMWVQISQRCRGDHNGNDGREFSNGRISSVENAIGISPNPTTGLFTIQLESDQTTIANITLMDMVGKTQLIIKKQLVEGNNNLDIDAMNLANGTYIVKCEINGMLTMINKVIINK